MMDDARNNAPLVIRADGKWRDPAIADFWLNSIFDDSEFIAGLGGAIRSGQVAVGDASAFTALIETVFAQNLRGDDDDLAGLRRQQELFRVFQSRAAWNVHAYDGANKPNPAAVFWPDPTNARRGGNLYETLPFVENHGIIGKETPVGSAGSCFAVEIARNLMARGFNYVAKERPVDEETGTRVEGALASDPPQFSANWGLLFNAPSFRQIAEKAFGEREFQRIVVENAGTPPFFSDPYRENVVFPSVAAYERNYDRHVAACRAALSACEVFIITLGLNECWEFPVDGSIMSRNPRGSDIAGLIRHRRLTVAENVAEIQRFIDVVRARNPALKLIVSVSPVPFLATALADKQHVVAANGHSKAVLRVAAQELAESNENVFYFPSYELVTMCCEQPWDADQRHVSRAAVARVMALFDAMFLKS